MKTIHKAQLKLINGIQILEIPSGGTIICADTQNDIPTLWYECDLPIKQKTTVKFLICGTGWEFNKKYQHLKTIFIGSFVWHIYIIPNSEVKIK